LTDGKMRKMVASWKFSRNKQQFFSKRNEDKKRLQGQEPINYITKMRQ
jgi:hypothetical protein